MESKGGTTDETFEEQCFLWEKGTFKNFYMQVPEWKKIKAQ